MIESFLFTALCLIAIFSYSLGMTDSYILGKWCYMIGALLLCLGIWAVKRLFSDKAFSVNIPMWSGAIIFVTFFQALYGLGQWIGWISSVGVHQVTGSFDNPAGFAASLVVGLPFAAVCHANMQRHIWKRLVWMMVFVIVCAVVVSKSRSGILAMIAMAGWLGYKHINLLPKLKTWISITLFCLVAVCFYFLKKDSADGRFLIWLCSWSMLMDAPLFGYGIGSFKAHYMDYQADFFDLHPDSAYAMLADNVQVPFNEYLSFLLDFGIVGMLVLLGLTVWIFRFSRNKCDMEGEFAICSLIGIAVFSLFSYPLTYPFTWVILVLDVYLLLKDSVGLKLPKQLAILVLVCAILGTYKLYRRMDAEFQWKKIAYFSTKENLMQYAELQPILGKDPYFLYNYAVALRETGLTDESLKVAVECRSYWADYDLELLLGNLYAEKEEWNLAQKSYQNAANMCPCRFMPLYCLFKLYKDTGRHKETAEMAKLIVAKPVKIPSGTVWQIKNLVRQYVERNVN